MDSAGFLRWLRHFSDAVPNAVQRPLILIYDGCSSPYNGEIVRESVRLLAAAGHAAPLHRQARARRARRDIREQSAEGAVACTPLQCRNGVEAARGPRRRHG